METSEILWMLGSLLCIIGFAAINAAYLVWLERKSCAHFQRRIGPKEVGPYGLLQPLADGAKLMTKQLLVPNNIDTILFKVAPIMVLVPAIMSFMTIPFSEGLVARNINVGLLMIFAFASINGMGILLGGWGSNNKYAIISAARAVSQSVAFEIPMLITVITVVMMTHTMDLNEIIRQQAGGFWNWNIFGGPKQFSDGITGILGGCNLMMIIAFIIFFICSLAETNRAPFDLGEAESELVAGFHTEYSGMGFGVFFMGEYANVVIGCALAVILFLGGWQCPLGLLPGVWWFLIKLYILICVVMWARWTYPRVTIYGLLNLSWKVLIPLSLFNLLFTSAFLKIF
jgi:NADH-quinone oxidoreductase subunit H